jgi:hypothetical protein
VQSAFHIGRYGPKDLQDDFSRREAAGQHADFGIARRFVRMAMCMMRTSQVYLPPDMRSTHIKPERRADYYLAMWPYLRDKWSKANALMVAFAKDKPLGQWRYIVQERTYKGVDGFAPIFAYLGTEGYLVNLEFREGKQHCQKNTPEFINDTLDYVRKITDQPILMRLDSGNDCQDNFPDDSRKKIQFIIKRNLRRESVQKWVDLAKKSGEQQHCRSGKCVWIGKTVKDINGNPLPYPIIFEVTERHIKKGQTLLFPEYQIDTYWCSLEQLPPDEVIRLYHDHGTSEQFHSELKSDMGLERLPSGHFSSNSLILHLAMLTYNMLRIIGQISLEESDPDELPGIRKKTVTRRRIRTVMQDLMYMAGRLVTRSRYWYLSFGQLNPFAKLMERIYLRLNLLSATK